MPCRRTGIITAAVATGEVACRCHSEVDRLQLVGRSDSQRFGVGSQTEQLLKLQDSASDGVISLSTAAFNRFVALRSRPYQVAVFVSAKHLLDKPQLKLRELRNEWSYLGKAFAKDAAVRGKVAHRSTGSALFMHRIEMRPMVSCLCLLFLGACAHAD